jgi:ribonuclease HII
MKAKSRKKFLIGIDEAGRGPLAGPVAVGVFAVRSRSILKKFTGVRDSKKLSTLQREAVFLQIKKAYAEGHIQYTVSYSSAGMIDTRGIVSAIRSALDRSLKKIERKVRSTSSKNFNFDDCEVLLDGTLYAPRRYANQKTIIRGDDIEPVISLASICAKVLRDRKMTRLSKKYPHYGFEIHKGYGTKSHYSAIRKYGLSKVHRRSFVKQYSL